MSLVDSSAPVNRPPLDVVATENFPVALRTLPRTYREDLLAIYSFARLVDDMGDEPGRDGPRALTHVLRDLDLALADLARAQRGDQVHLSPLAGLTDLFARCHPPIDCFEALVRANVVDQVRREYVTREDLLAYCAMSANPVGRLVLAVFHVDATPSQLRASDDVCSALQIIEHLQDVREDAARGRFYLPADDRRDGGVSRADLLADRANAAVRALIAEETAWALDLLRRGSVLVGALRGWSRLVVAAYVGGGAAAAAALRRAGWDPLQHPVAPRRSDVVRATAGVYTRGGLA